MEDLETLDVSLTRTVHLGILFVIMAIASINNIQKSEFNSLFLFTSNINDF